MWCGVLPCNVHIWRLFQCYTKRSGSLRYPHETERRIFLTNRVAMDRALAAFHVALDDLKALIATNDAAGLDRVLGAIRSQREHVR